MGQDSKRSPRKVSKQAVVRVKGAHQEGTRERGSRAACAKVLGQECRGGAESAQRPQGLRTPGPQGWRDGPRNAKQSTNKFPASGEWLHRPRYSTLWQCTHLSQMKFTNTSDERNRSWHDVKCKQETAKLLTSGVLLPLQHVISIIHLHATASPQTPNPPTISALVRRCCAGLLDGASSSYSRHLQCPIQIFMFNKEKSSLSSSVQIPTPS